MSVLMKAIEDQMMDEFTPTLLRLIRERVKGVKEVNYGKGEIQFIKNDITYTIKITAK